MNITLCLPSAFRTSCMATREPSASPSGFSCVTSRKRSEAPGSADQIVERVQRALDPRSFRKTRVEPALDGIAGRLQAPGGVPGEGRDEHRALPGVLVADL